MPGRYYAYERMVRTWYQLESKAQKKTIQEARYRNVAIVVTVVFTLLRTGESMQL